MTFSYYPGCTLKTKAKDLDFYGREAAKALGVTLEELPDWQCCGAYYPLAEDEIATKLSSVRALASAKKQGNDLVTLCSACHNVIKRVNNDLLTNEKIRSRVNNYLAPDISYIGDTKVVHYLEMLRDFVGFDKIKGAVTNSLGGKKIVSYYGCLLLRPSDVMQFDDPENPTIMENLVEALGGEAIISPVRNECCGGCVTLNNPALSEKASSRIVDLAMNSGAEMILTACPLCLYNLKKAAEGKNIEIKYFTEVLADALGIKMEG